MAFDKQWLDRVAHELLGIPEGYVPPAMRSETALCSFCGHPGTEHFVVTGSCCGILRDPESMDETICWCPAYEPRLDHGSFER